MSEKSDPLDLLLLAASEDIEEFKQKPKTLKETNLFEQESNLSQKSIATTAKGTFSLLHTGDTDSSDDEDKRNWEESRYTENGREIKRLLDTASCSLSSTRLDSVFSDTKRISHCSNWNKSLVSDSNKGKILKSVNPETTKKLVEPITKTDVYTDPIFGLRIINPLVSSAILQERMVGREVVTFDRLNRFLQIKTKDKDWVFSGVIVNKTAPKTSQKGNQFSVWTVSDLKGDIKTVALFLFSGAHQQLWKTTIGTVVGILNPNVLDKKEGRDEVSLSIDNAQKVMILGQSKDFGICKSVKKNGDKCMAIVNINRCEFCVYHIKQEYQKCSIRSDLQSSFGGKGLTALRNKVLGKNEVFYAGKSYTAIPANKSRKLELKDNERLNGLLGKGSTKTTVAKTNNCGVKKKAAARLDVSHAQKMKDLILIEKLNGVTDLSEKTNFDGKQSSGINIDEAKILATSVVTKLKAKYDATDNKTDASIKVNNNNNFNISNTSSNSNISKLDLSDKVEVNVHNTLNEAKVNKKPEIKKHFSQPKKFTPSKNESKLTEPTTNKLINFNNPELSGSKYTFPKLSGFDSGLVDLNKPITPRRIDKAKLNAIQLIKKNGPIKKVDPNNLRGSENRIKRSFDGEKCEPEAKKTKVESNGFTSERFKKIMAAASNHEDLLEARDEEEKEKYFFKLEAKEKMEEKMISTHKVACKAVKCFQCKYVSFSASDLCKSERHPLKVFDAIKRFYKCSHCQNRTVCLEVVPLIPCNNCGYSKWEKTGMMKEKLVTASNFLSIRGGEQKHLNSNATDTHLDLLVPD